MPEFTPEQKRVICHEKGNLLVSAAAGSGKTAEILRFYDKDGNKADTLQKDTWYTAVLMLTTGNKGGFWGSMRFSPRGGSEETPAIMYYNNLRYSCVDPKA